MQHSFIQNKEGRNGNRWYFLSFLIIALGVIIGTYLSNPLNTMIQSRFVDDTTSLYVKNILNLSTMYLPFVGLLVGLVITARFILKRSIKTFITPAPQINFKKIGFGFSLFAGIMMVSHIAFGLLFKEHYSFEQPAVSDYALLVLFVMILAPIQTTAEELFFRGFLLQWYSKISKQPVILALIVGFFFGMMHFSNPEMGTDKWITGFNYVFVGFSITYITIKTNSSELAIGLHAANNMFLMLFIKKADSVVGDIPSLFLVSSISPLISTMFSLMVYTLFYLTIRHKKIIHQRF
jgi:membrane protease YdiL (CAAX protease family)